MIIILLTGSLLPGITDPNTPIIPPRPGTESITVINQKTLRVTTSRDISKKFLTRRLARLLAEKEQIEDEIAIVTAKLEAFE